jgi:hypothetical protein
MHRGMHALMFNLAFPSAALPASGSMGIISARYYFRHPFNDQLPCINTSAIDVANVYRNF